MVDVRANDVTIHGFTGSLVRTNRDTPAEVWQFVFFFPGCSRWILLPASDTKEGAIALATEILATREKFGAFLIGTANDMLMQLRDIDRKAQGERAREREILRQDGR